MNYLQVYPLVKIVLALHCGAAISLLLLLLIIWLQQIYRLILKGITIFGECYEYVRW